MAFSGDKESANQCKEICLTFAYLHIGFYSSGYPHKWKTAVSANDEWGHLLFNLEISCSLEVMLKFFI